MSRTDGSAQSCVKPADDELLDALQGTCLVEDSSKVTFAGNGKRVDTADDAIEFVQAIDNCAELRKLNLEGNTFAVPACEAIGKALEKKPTLTHALFKDIFTTRLKTEVPDSLRFLTSGIQNSGAQLYELDLSDNAFGPIGMEALESFLTGSTCANLEVLRLQNNGLGIGGGRILAKCLPSLKKLRIFICGRNRLCMSSDPTEDAAVQIGESLTTLRNLEYIQMIQNGTRIEGIKALANAIKLNKNVNFIDLNDNIITAAGSIHIAEAIKATAGLKHLNLCDCLLKKDGGLRILNALNELKDVSKLSEIALSGNELGGQELADEIFRFVRRSDRNKNLKFELSSNNFGSLVDEVRRELSNHRVALQLTDDEGSADEDEEEEEQDQVEEKVSSLKISSNGSSDPNTNVDDLCGQFVKVSLNGFNSKTNSLSPSALKETETLLESAKKKSTSPYQVANSLLGNLGLIKVEGERNTPRKVKVTSDLRGPILALSASAKKLSKEEKDTLGLFLGRDLE